MASLVTLAEFKDYLGTEMSRNDANLQTTLDAAESAVFQHLRRRVELVADDAVASTRLFVPTTRWYVETDDFTELDTVSDGDFVVTSDYYQLEPLNNRAASGEYRPYSAIRRTVGGQWWRWDRESATVAVSAVWGWAEIPPAIRLAILMVGKDLRSSKDVQYGILFGETAAVRIRQNPTVMELLRDFRKDPVMIA